MNGHIFNWYDIETLRAIPPLIISTVDSGNLAASLYALHGGALDLLKRPLLDPQPFRSLALMLIDQAVEVPVFRADTAGLIAAVAWLSKLHLQESTETSSWKSDEAKRRQSALLAFVAEYAPWLLPRFNPLFAITHFRDPDDEFLASLHQAPIDVRNMEGRLRELLDSEPQSPRRLR